MERTNWQTLQKVYNAKHRLIRPSAKLDVQSSHKYWNRDCGLLAMDYGSETMGYIWTINSGMNFFFGVIAKLTQIFFSMSTLIFFQFFIL